MFWIIITVISLLIYIIAKRNSFEQLRQQVTQSGSNIGIYMEKRSACLNDAMRIAKTSYSHEVEGIGNLTAGDQLNQLAFLGQKYPDLRSIDGYDQIIRQAMVLNDELTSARRIMDGNIQSYNQAISAFPGLLVASLFGYKKEKFIDEDNILQNKHLEKSQVDFPTF